MVPVNYLAVLGATLLSVVIGSLWYGPIFGKTWTKLMGWTKADMAKGAADKNEMTKSYGIQFVGSFFMAFVLSHALVFASTYLETSGVSAGIQTGFWNWLGFVAPVTLTSVLWEGKPWKLWLINNGYNLVTLCAMGVLLSLWV
jgi:hypothetical protein